MGYDEDGDNLVYYKVDEEGPRGTLTYFNEDTGDARYEPNNDFVEADVFEYGVMDECYFLRPTYRLSMESTT